MNISIIQQANTNEFIGKSKRHHWTVTDEEASIIRNSYALTRFTIIKSAREKEEEFINYILDYCKNTTVEYVHFTSEGIFFQSGAPINVNSLNSLLETIIAEKSKRAINEGVDPNCSILSQSVPLRHYLNCIGFAIKDLHVGLNILRVKLCTALDYQGGTFLLKNSTRHGIYEVSTKKLIASKKKEIIDFNFKHGYVSTASRVPGVNFSATFETIKDIYEYIQLISQSSKKTIYTNVGLSAILKDIKNLKLQWPNSKDTISTIKSLRY